MMWRHRCAVVGTVELSQLRIPGVLQRLALTYFAVALMQVFFAGRGQRFDAEQVRTRWFRLILCGCTSCAVVIRRACVITHHRSYFSIQEHFVLRFYNYVQILTVACIALGATCTYMYAMSAGYRRGVDACSLTCCRTGQSGSSRQH